jgi:hypothetical protein
MPLVLPKPSTGPGVGSPTDYVPGSGLAVPTGIESLFEYNGFLMNDITLVETYLILKVDGLDDADVRDTRENNPADDGEEPGEAFYGGRTVILTGQIQAGSLNKLRDMQSAMKSAFVTLVERPLIVRTGNWERDHFVRARKVGKIQMLDEQKDGRWFRDFMITMRASNPRIFSYKEYVAQRIFSFYDDFSSGVNVNYTFE